MRLPVLSTLLLAPTLAVAQPWSGEIAAGYLGTSGNSDTQSLNGKVALNYEQDKWKNLFVATALGSADADGSTAERYTAGNKTEYSITPNDYVFVALEWEKDLFGGIRQRTSETVGYGRRILTGPVHELDVEVGIGARQTEENVTGFKDDDLVGRFAGRYAWIISETSSFVQALKVETGDANTSTESISELKLAIVGNLHAMLSYTVRHNSDVPAGTKRTDTFTAVNLAYSFGKS